MKKRIIAMVIAFILLLSTAIGSADGDVYEVYILCKTYVNARMSPTKRSQSVGMLDNGMALYTDGKKRNGWLHLVDNHLENSEVWVKDGYVTTEKPIIYEDPKTFVVVAPNRVAARRTIKGEFIRWLKNGEKVKVYSISDWAVTNKGYVMSEYLEESWDD